MGMESQTKKSSYKQRRAAQISALDLKNRLIYKRRKDQVFQEIFTTVELLGLLVVFALLPNGSKTEPTQLTFLNDSITAIGGVATQAELSASDNSNQSTRIVFGDDTAGCSSSLLAFAANNVSICGSSSANCTCAATALFSDGQYIKNNGIDIAVEFASFEADPGKYTLHLEDIGLTVSTPMWQSTKTGRPNEAAGIFRQQVLSAQVAIDAAIAGRSIAVTVERFPQLAYDIWDPGALINYPMYMTMLMFYGILTITIQMVEETEKELKQGLFMIGLDPFVYYFTWLKMLVQRQFVGCIITCAISKLICITRVDFFALFLVFFLCAFYTILLAIVLSMAGMTSKMAGLFCTVVPMGLSALSYAYSPLISNPLIASPIPREALLLLSFIFPPVGFGLTLTTAMRLNNAEDGGFGFHNMAEVTNIGVSGAEMIGAILVGIVVMAVLAWHLASTTRGIAVDRDGDNDDNGADTGADADGEVSTSETRSSESVSVDSDADVDRLETGGRRVAVSIRNLKKHFGSLKAVDGLLTSTKIRSPSSWGTMEPARARPSRF